MQKIAVIQISEAGENIANRLQRELGAKRIQRTDVGRQWTEYDGFVFVGAMGICVRTIAPYIKDKHEDPAVVCIDSLGQHVISVLSGHVGGANDLTRQMAALFDAHEVITTQSDNAGLWALDTFEQRFDWPVASDIEDMNDCIFAFVNRKPTALLLEARDEGTDYLEATKPDHVTIINDIS
jgi:cobalamin biosynthesis protein CbiG